MAVGVELLEYDGVVRNPGDHDIAVRGDGDFGRSVKVGVEGQGARRTRPREAAGRTHLGGGYLRVVGISAIVEEGQQALPLGSMAEAVVLGGAEGQLGNLDAVVGKLLNTVGLRSW